MAFERPAWVDGYIEAFGDRVWLTAPGDRRRVVEDGGGLVVIADRSFDLELTDISSPMQAWGVSHGLIVLPLGAGGGSSFIRFNGEMRGDPDVGAALFTKRGDLNFWNIGRIEARTAIIGRAEGRGILTIDNGGYIGGASGMHLGGTEVVVHNSAGAMIRADEYAAITMDAKLGSITNYGVIAGLSYMATIGGYVGAFTLTNEGMIIGRYDALDLSHMGYAEIGNSGEVIGQVTGSDGDDLLVNSGRMDGVALGKGDDGVQNLGQMGKVALGLGDDLFSAEAGGTQGVVLGGRGDDTLTGAAQDDRFFGGDGRDSLAGGGGDDRLSGGEEADRLAGGSGDDLLRGDNGFDTLRGDVGEDRIFGGDGGDRIYGGVGEDWLDGGDGTDHLFGGEGADVFVLDPTTQGWDRIADFTPGEDHFTIAVEMTWIGDDGFTGRPGELRWNGHGVWFEADLDGDMVADWRTEVWIQGFRPSDQDFL